MQSMELTSFVVLSGLSGSCSWGRIFGTEEFCFAIRTLSSSEPLSRSANLASEPEEASDESDRLLQCKTSYTFLTPLIKQWKPRKPFIRVILFIFKMNYP